MNDLLNSEAKSFSIKAAAKLTGIPMPTISNAVQDGRLKAKQKQVSRKKPGKVWSINRESLIKFAQGWPHKPVRSVKQLSVKQLKKEILVLEEDKKDWIRMSTAIETFKVPRETIKAAIRTEKVLCGKFPRETGKGGQRLYILLEPQSMAAYADKYWERRNRIERRRAHERN